MQGSADTKVQCEQEGHEMFHSVLDLLRHEQHTEDAGNVHSE